MILNLTIQSKKTILNDITLYEKIDVSILDKLINSTLLKEVFNNPFSTVSHKNEREQLIKYKELYDETNKGCKVIYNRVKGMNFGRVNPQRALGLYSIRREIRHTLAKNNYIDIDIENCHPQLLYQICKSNLIKCDNLKYYIENRNKILHDTMTTYNVDRDEAKKLFIRLLYLGSYSKWLEEKQLNEVDNETNKFINDFKNELSEISKVIVSNNKKLFQEVEKNKQNKKINDYNINSSVCSYFLQEYENQILETIYLYCFNNNLIDNDAVLCADGIMINKNKYYPELLDELQTHIYKTNGFNLILTTKEMNQDYLNILDDSQATTPIKDNIELFKSIIDASIYDLLNMILNDVKDKYIQIGIEKISTYYKYNEKLKLWETIPESNIIMNIIETLLNKLNYNITDEDKKTKEYITANKICGDTKKAREILTLLKDFIYNNEFEEKLNRSRHTYIPIKGGYCIDLETGKKIERTINDYFTFEIDCDYNENDTTEEADNFFMSIMNNNIENCKYLQKVIGSFLVSQEEAQSIYIFWGNGSNGKSALMSLISKVMGNFYSPVDKGIFIDNKNKNNLGPKPELLVLKDIRVAVISETDSNEKLNQTLLKELSGGDTITARNLFSKTPIKFKPRLSPVILTNNKPIFDSKDDGMIRRIKLIPFKAKFKDNPDYKKGEQKLNRYLVKQLSEKYLNQILKWMVQGAVEFIKDPNMTPTDDLLKDMESYLSEIDPSTNYFTNNIIRTNDMKDRVKVGDLYSNFKQWLFENGITIPVKKTDFIKTMDKTIGEQKKINGYYYYTNIKIIDDDISDEE